MLARTTTFAIDGLEPRRVTVEVDIRTGLPGFTVVGLADAAVREARERVRAAILNSGFEFPQRRITANLAPAYLRKVGPGFDLALAVALLAAAGQVDADRLEQFAVFGELSLSGELRPGRGTLLVAEGSRAHGISGLIVPTQHAAEARLVDSLDVVALSSLTEVASFLCGDRVPDPPMCSAAPPAVVEGPDLSEVRGQAEALGAVEVAAAGGHNVLLQGPPGTGKTMIARRVPSILPPLTREEAFAVTRIHSVAGLHHAGGLATQRPFRAPHHTVSASGLVGGGSIPRPGEASLAHQGVLFLDELSEFSRAGLEALRQPLEDGAVTIVRGQHAAQFPCRVILVASSNPCPCGFAGEEGDRCRCTEVDHARHRRSLSGPLLDRIDLLINVRRPTANELRSDPTHQSDQVRARVSAARARQVERLAGTSAGCNAQMGTYLTRTTVSPTVAALRLLASSYDKGDISARGHQRVLRVARTIADLEDSETVERRHVGRALGHRQFESGTQRDVAA